MQKFIFSIILALAIFNLSAQPIYFSKQFKLFPNGYSAGFRLTTMPDGYAFTTLEGSNTNPEGSIRYITDKKGNVLNIKQFLPKTSKISGLVYHPEDSTFHYWGDVFIGAGQHLYRPFLLKTNWWGDTIWRAEFDYTAYNFCRNVIQVPDGGFIMALSTSTPDSSIIGLIKVDSNGQEEWHKDFKTGFYNYNTYGLLLKNDSTLMVGYDAMIYALDTLLPHDGYGILETDLEGNLLKDTFYLTAYYNGENYTGWLVPLGGDTVAFVNRTKSLDQNATQWINAIDGDLNLIWQRYSSNIAFSEYIPTLTVNNKNNIVGGGIVGYFEISPHIFEMSPEGEVLWERIAKSPILGQQFTGSSSFETIRQTEDGGYIIVGNFVDSLGFRTWLLKLDSLGCFEPGCQDSNFLTLKAEEAPQAPPHNPSLSVSPNPASEGILVTVHNGPGVLTITDVQGRPTEPALQHVEASISIPTKDWPSGTYLIRYRSEKGRLLGVKKLVIQH